MAIEENDVETEVVYAVEEVNTERREHFAVTAHGRAVLYTNDGQTARAMASTLNESRRLRAAFDAAYDYIHGGQDRGAESQARYTAWIEARDRVTG